MGSLQIGVLGPVEAHLDGNPVCLSRRKEQVVLAALTVSLNKAVSTDTLLDEVWNGAPPRSGRDTLQSIVSRLRRRLGRQAIETVDHSYRLCVDPDRVDACRFEGMVGSASSLLADDPATAGSLTKRALALWRGPPFGDLRAAFLEPEARRLDSLRLTALEVHFEGEVECGRFASAVAGLQAEVLEHPYRERLWYLLILAMARDGCRVDALRACHALRADLIDIGLEPSIDIRRLEQMVLTEDPAVRSDLHR